MRKGNQPTHRSNTSCLARSNAVGKNSEKEVVWLA
jgi:hypothetical protein